MDKLEQVRMPVFSWDYEDLPVHELWFRMADAYLVCAIHLLYEMAEERIDRDFFRAKVCDALYCQSIELFFKGALAIANKEIINSHNLSILYDRYLKMYPEKEFRFEVKMEKVVKENVLWKYNEFARYPVDKDGKPWQGNTHFDIIVLLKNALLTQKDFLRLTPLLLKKYKKNPS